ncbi:hypothetical protein AMTR_s00008p00266600 [Amborella trichopoda]|uniref:Uncharacterized protein n=1 Tax=Amborella trichopoda TaxID=13333 RepID=W1NJ32_AMBTC|nr:hypothetical protein AMTR_s00008p00266600 [Amborella trichopoda]
MHAPEATQEEAGTLRARPFSLSAAQSLDSPAPEGPLGSNPLGLHTVSKAMTPLAFRDLVLDVPPLDVIGFYVAPQPSSGSKAFIRAWLVLERDSLSEEVASLSGELEIVKAEMEELQAQVASLSSHRDST